MKDLIIRLLAGLHDGSLNIISARYSIAGSCINFEIDHPFDVSLSWKTTCQQSEIVAALQLQGLIIGFDKTTRVVYMPEAEQTDLLHRAYDAVIDDYEAFHKALLENHLQSALYILDAEEDAEDLFNRYFHDYTLIERQALLWRLAMQPSIENYHVQQSYIQLLEYADGKLLHMPRTTDLRMAVYAKWLKDNHLSLFGLCRPIGQPGANNYVTTIA